ncbi:phage tail tip fiber protein, partial [Kaistia sp. MMO-174]
AGMVLDIVGGVSRCMFQVDKFSIGNGATNVVPFAIVDGVVYMSGVVIKSSNSVVQLDLRNDAMIFTEP